MASISGRITETLSDWVTSLPQVGGQAPSDDDGGSGATRDYTDILWDAEGGPRTSGVKNFMGWRGFLNRNTKVEHDRKSRYRDYDMMSTDPIIEPAVELYVDESFDRNLETNRKVWPTPNEKYLKETGSEGVPEELTDPDKMRKELENFLYRTANVESNLHDWGNEVAQKGDFFVRNRIEEGEGIYYVEDDLHPADIQRIEINGQLVGFSSQAIKNHLTGTGSASEKGLFGPEEFTHFRLFGPNRRERLEERDNIVTVKNDEGERFRVTAKYGWSVLEPCRKVFKEWRLLKDSLILARVTRSARKNVVGIDVGNMPPSEAVDVVSRYQELVSSTKAVDVDEGDLEERIDPGEYNDWIFIPLRGQVQDMSVQELGGDVDIKGIADIEEKKKQLFGALKVNPGMLHEGGDDRSNLNPGSSLKRQDIRFAKQARRLQQSVIVGLKQMCLIHLHAKYQRPVDPKAFDIESSWTSTAEQVERAQAMDDQFNFVNTMIQMISNLSGRGGGDDEFSLNKKYIVAWAFEFMNIPNFDAEKAMGLEDEEDIDEAKQKASEEEKEVGKQIAEEMHQSRQDVTSRHRSMGVSGNYQEAKEKHRERFGEGIEVENGYSENGSGTEEPEGSVVRS